MPFFFFEQKLSLAFHRVDVCDLYLRLLRSDIVFDSAYPFFWEKVGFPYQFLAPEVRNDFLAIFSALLEKKERSLQCLKITQKMSH